MTDLAFGTTAVATKNDARKSTSNNSLRDAHDILVDDVLTRQTEDLAESVGFVGEAVLVKRSMLQPTIGRDLLKDSVANQPVSRDCLEVGHRVLHRDRPPHLFDEHERFEQELVGRVTQNARQVV